MKAGAAALLVLGIVLPGLGFWYLGPIFIAVAIAITISDQRKKKKARSQEDR